MSKYVEIHADGWRFQPRVAAVCVWQDHVLLQGALDGPFWVLPGGRLLPLELTADALVRTMRWEIGQEVTVQRLLWVMEYVTPIGGQPVHELGFYYAIELPENSPFFELSRDHAGVERGHDLVLVPGRCPAGPAALSGVPAHRAAAVARKPPARHTGDIH